VGLTGCHFVSQNGFHRQITNCHWLISRWLQQSPKILFNSCLNISAPVLKTATLSFHLLLPSHWSHKYPVLVEWFTLLWETMCKLWLWQGGVSMLYLLALVTCMPFLASGFALSEEQTFFLLKWSFWASCASSL
jgi:hypothetical protein